VGETLEGLWVPARAALGGQECPPHTSSQANLDRKNDSMERRASSPAGRASCERRDALRESPLTAKLAKKGRKEEPYGSGFSISWDATTCHLPFRFTKMSVQM
jgi:hypothetical protein